MMCPAGGGECECTEVGVCETKPDSPSLREETVKYIKRIDVLFDGVPGDKEYAYHSMRHLALELLEVIEEEEE